MKTVNRQLSVMNAIRFAGEPHTERRKLNDERGGGVSEAAWADDRVYLKMRSTPISEKPISPLRLRTIEDMRSSRARGSNIPLRCCRHSSLSRMSTSA